MWFQIEIYTVPMKRSRKHVCRMTLNNFTNFYFNPVYLPQHFAEYQILSDKVVHHKLACRLIVL